jgi:hypothetical protein
MVPSEQVPLGITGCLSGVEYTPVENAMTFETFPDEDAALSHSERAIHYIDGLGSTAHDPDAEQLIPDHSDMRESYEAHAKTQEVSDWPSRK